MLVLSRKIGERIVIPQLGVEILVAAVAGNKVRLGFAAPDEVDIFRAEVWEKVSQEPLASPQRD